MLKLLKNPLIKAGAGTGKTETLISSVYDLFKEFTLEKGCEPKLIVCTFTRKASQELKERLFKKALEEMKSLSSNNKLQTAPPFLNYLRSSLLQVSTIDGILSRFLKKQSSHIDLNPDFEISYSFVNEELFDSLAEQFIYDKYFCLLQTFPYPILRDIFISYFNNRLKYKNISFYTEEDFAEFRKDRDMIYSLIESKSSFDSFLKLKPELNLLDSEKIKALVKEDEKFLKDDFVPVFEELKKAGEELFPLFLEKKKNSSVLHIEDLLLLSYHLLKEKPLIAQIFSEEWDYWFIDEYQDTSWLQEQVIQELTKFKNVFCVGDPGQSIYSFRGADPQVFYRRESELKDSITKLEINRRSSSELIEFYNDFFSKEDFIKFNSPSQKKTSSVKPYLSFFTYNKTEEEYEEGVFHTLFYYIQKLRKQGVDYKKIAVLSSRNEEISKAADYLRKKNLPVILYSSNKFSKNRLVLDSLFLLKFLINPYDDINLKALLRTPYFRLKDQDLADSSFQYHLNKEECFSFWSFIKDKYKESLFVKQLEIYLDHYKKFGLFESFTHALFDSALMDLSYWQDPSSCSFSNLWKLVGLLYNRRFSELQLFYDLTAEEEKEDKDHLKEARPCEENSAVSLMTIHKSKGLEFEHVILLDFTMNTSVFQKNSKREEAAVFDRKRNKMAVAVPIGGREKKKIRSYGHELYNHSQSKVKVLEAERLYYVAMTRAKDSLAVFLPHGCPPKKNSWLKEAGYFSQVKGLLQTDENSKTWMLNSGLYKQDSYNLAVQSCNEINQNPESFINSFKKTSALQLGQTTSVKPSVSGKSKQAASSNQSAGFKAAAPGKTGASQKASSLNVVLSDKFHQKEIKNNSCSSKDFIQFINQTESQKKPVSSLMKTKNILFKTSLGNQLHFFLQKLCCFPCEKLDSLISSSPFLSKENQEKIKQALFYVQKLKEPDISSCFKTGYSEWSFKYQRENIIFKGQIDLWSWSDDEIYLFDYKSAPSKNVKNQLIFYSWILDQMYQAKAIWMYECYPLEEKTQKTLYQTQHKELFKTWLNSLNK